MCNWRDGLVSVERRYSSQLLPLDSIDRDEEDLRVRLMSNPSYDIHRRFDELVDLVGKLEEEFNSDIRRTAFLYMRMALEADIFDRYWYPSVKRFPLKKEDNIFFNIHKNGRRHMRSLGVDVICSWLPSLDQVKGDIVDIDFDVDTNYKCCRLAHLSVYYLRIVLLDFVLHIHMLKEIETIFKQHIRDPHAYPYSVTIKHNGLKSPSAHFTFLARTPTPEPEVVCPKDNDECVVCMDNPKSMVIVPCGHKCLCANCVAQVQQQRVCPVCRGTIEKIVRVFD